MEIRDLVNAIDEKLSGNDDESSMELKDLVDILEGRLVGNDEYFSIDGFTGKFTFLNDAHTGDIVVRDWVDEKGIAIAFKKMRHASLPKILKIVLSKWLKNSLFL